MSTPPKPLFTEDEWKRLSPAIRQKLIDAENATRNYAAQQQTICILLERVGGSVTIGQESWITQRRGTIHVHEDPDTGAITISFTPESNLSA